MFSRAGPAARMQRPGSAGRQRLGAGYIAGFANGPSAVPMVSQPVRANANIRALSQPLGSSVGSRMVPGGNQPQRALPAEVEQMVIMLDQRVTHAIQADESKVRMQADQVQRLVEGLQAMKVAREIHEERRLKEARMIENSLQLDLQNARQARKEIESRAEDLSSSRLAELSDELRRE